ncbi:glycoside hydrolase family 31 protein [Orrella marina]|uniref:Glycosyl hydrolase n=1 Tax=Orrella marina TaxID=2163011 RepID=A0A2R4XKD5_9BURK|nr:glycoside hydrolase family 31 protein [Orrella marina]AWB34241.1 glycosyl hydrolase [Orrella marina]
MNLDTLKLLESSASKHLFDAGSGSRLVVEPHAPGMYRLRIGESDAVASDLPARPRARAQAEMLLARAEVIGEAELTVVQEPASWLIRHGQTGVILGQSPFRISLVRFDEEDRMHPVASSTSDGICHQDGHWSVAMELRPDEAVHGLGQTSTDLNRRGEYIVSDDPAHRALPLAWSPTGWGLYVNAPGRTDHDVGVDDPNAYRVYFQSPVFDIFLFAGDPGDILNQYTALTGRAGQPSLWALGAWLRQPRDCSASQLLELVRKLREQGVCLDAVMMREPMAWSFNEAKLSLEWDAERFPDPKRALDLFASESVHVCLPTLPAIKASSSTFAELEDRGWLLANEDTADACVFTGNDVTGGDDFALLDLTHKDVYQVWTERHRQLAEDGVAAVSCSTQFDIPDDITARSGESGAVLRTLYPVLTRTALFEAWAGNKVPPEGVVLTSDLMPAAQRFPWQAPTVVEQSWGGMCEAIRLALSTGSSGVPLQMLAIGDESQDPATVDTQLTLRWLAMAVFSGNFQFENPAALMSDKWDDTSREAMAHWMQWRYRLIPYVLGAIEDAARTGLPVQRSMAMSFPADLVAHEWDTQYLLGPAVLVAPVTHPGKQTEIYLPEGDAWWDLATGWRYEGGTTLTLEVGLDSIPLFGREGHMLCLGPAASHTGEFNSARILEEVWMFGMPVHNPVVMRNKIRVMQMQGSSYIKGLEGLKIMPSEGLEVKRRGAEVRISRAR